MRHPHNWHKEHKESLTMGERAADRLRNTMGSWTFVFTFILFLALWITINKTHGIHHWDKYPFILLNLFLSMLAALQGAILLIAAKRVDNLASLQAKRDLDTDLASKVEIETLMQQNREQLQAIAELKKLLTTPPHERQHSQTSSEELSEIAR